ncbi:uncharacterized protein LOC116803688 [Drosophila mojavensis]|uniref:uncharacterized protein LOC116803688 n=1 Tax=Drosophila mojavensis TaxID=7230 RepID=UPI0013EEA820|nr:uncharacterized protein LOC116803688 [Drosophila mojavensis]
MPLHLCPGVFASASRAAPLPHPVHPLRCVGVWHSNAVGTGDGGRETCFGSIGWPTEVVCKFTLTQIPTHRYRCANRDTDTDTGTNTFTAVAGFGGVSVTQSEPELE